MAEKIDYNVFEALDPFFKITMQGLSGLVDGEHYFDTFAEDAVFESRYRFPGWPEVINGRASLMAASQDTGGRSRCTPRMLFGFTARWIAAW